MHRFLTTVTVLALVIGLSAVPSGEARAHGEVDEAMLAEFHLHLDDFRDDVEHLIAEVEPIVAAYAGDEDVGAMVEELIHEWEEVGIHAAIESRATPLYPGVWQALIALQQAVSAGRPADAVADAGDAVAAALWQGLGGVRLAASQVERGTAAAPAGEPPESGPQAIDAIVADLEQAVAAYAADDPRRAEALIHDTYMNRFEWLEGDLIEHDPELVSNLEKDFNATLPLLIQQGAAMDRVNQTLDAMKRQLGDARDILARAEQSRSEVF